MDTERGILVVGHGTVSDLNDMAEFLRRIRRGRPASPELVTEIQRRYRCIGRSPLLDVTTSLANALETRLQVRTRVAMRFWSPLVEDVLAEFCATGVTELCILPVAPFSVPVYVGVVAEALAVLTATGARVPKIVSVPPYGSDPSLVAAQASTVRAVINNCDPASTRLVLTAHSLPTRVIAAGDTYQTEFEDSARRIADAVGWSATIAYQSQGADGGDWLGPTLYDTLVAAREHGKERVVVAPVGFLADHVETLYDLDVEAADQARAIGLDFARSRALGDDPMLVAALGDLVRRAFARGDGS